MIKLFHSKFIILLRHANFISSLEYVNDLGALIGDDKMKNINYQNFDNYMCCEGAQSDDMKSRNLKFHRCLSRWNIKHCFLHKKSNSNCEGSLF